MPWKRIFVCFAATVVIFASGCGPKRAPGAKPPPSPALDKINIGTCMDFYKILGVGSNDAWRAVESNGVPALDIPGNCEYLHAPAGSVRLPIMINSSSNLRSSSCWNEMSQSFVFYEGPSFLILTYYGVGERRRSFGYTDFPEVAAFTQVNLTEHGRDAALLDICPDIGGQRKGPWPGNWQELNFAVSEGDDYYSILQNIFGAIGGGNVSRGGTEGTIATAGSQSVEPFKFRNMVLDSEITLLISEHGLIFEELKNYVRPISEALYRKKNLLETARGAAVERGDKKNAEKLEKELERVVKEENRYSAPISLAEHYVGNWRFAGIEVDGPIKSLIDAFPVKVSDLLDVGVLSVQFGEETVDLEDLKKNKMEFIPRTEREPLAFIAKKRSDLAVKVQEKADANNRELAKIFEPELFSELIARPGDPILIQSSFTGAKHIRGGEPKIKVRISEEIYLADGKDIVDMNSGPITDSEVVIFKLDDLIAKGITSNNFPGVGNVDFLRMKEDGYIWSPPIAFRKQGAESVLPRDEEEYMETFEFLHDGFGHAERLTAISLVLETRRMFGEIPCVLAPGVYKIRLTLIDTLRDADDKKREIELPTFTFRIMYPGLGD